MPEQVLDNAGRPLWFRIGGSVASVEQSVVCAEQDCPQCSMESYRIRVKSQP